MDAGDPGTAEYRQHVLKGSNSAIVVGGFGITEGVDEATFDAWYERHKLLPWARQDLVFKMKNTTEAQARALDHSEQKNGLERLSPDKLPSGVEEDKGAMAKVRQATR